MLKRKTLKVKGSFNDLPDSLDIDITELSIGMSVKVHQLSYENLELLDPKRAMVVAAISSRMAIKEEELEEEEEEVVVEEEEGVEGEEGTEAAADGTEASKEDDSKAKKEENR